MRLVSILDHAYKYKALVALLGWPATIAQLAPVPWEICPPASLLSLPRPGTPAQEQHREEDDGSWKRAKTSK